MEASPNNRAKTEDCLKTSKDKEVRVALSGMYLLNNAVNNRRVVTHHNK